MKRKAIVRVKQRPPSARKSVEEWKAPRERAEELQPKLLPKLHWAKLSVLLLMTTRLCSALEDGRFAIDNNLFENNIRPTAVGRKRWLFIGRPQAGWRNAVYSLPISARQRGLNRWA
jgi:hypothetical protein